MGLPNINIIFEQKARTVLKFSDRGIGAIIVRDAAVTAGAYTLKSISDTPKGISTTNKAYIERAFKGNVNSPQKIYLYVLATTAINLSEAFKYLETVKFDYFCITPEAAVDEVTAAKTWVLAQWEAGNTYRAVLPNCAADSEAIVNFTTNDIVVGTDIIDAPLFCSRIMGIILGTPLEISCTSAVLNDVTDCEHLSKADMDIAIDAGKFIIFNDGEKVKVARGINSLSVFTATKTSDYKKIKIIDIISQIKDDLKMAIEDGYVGKYANTYDNKCLLLTAIQNYFETLEKEGLLEDGSEVDFDIESIINYLKTTNVDTSSMSEDDIRTQPTGSYVFIRCKIKILDAIEDVILKVYH